jgi:tetratricopeptide (TPR) repeat protein
MRESLTLKPISKAAIPRALEKAERYRLLNDPEQAESICLDILAADPDNQPALVGLILSVTDQFGSHRARSVQLAREYVGRLTNEYQRSYYEGLVWERAARARLGQPGPGLAYDDFRSAMACYERANAMSPADDDDAILRWNACLRTIERANLGPRPHEMEQPLE